MSTTVGDLLVTLGVDMSKFDSQLNNAESKAKESGRTIGDAMKSGFGFAAGMAGFNGLAGAIQNTVGAGVAFDSNMQQNTIGFTTMLGSAKQAQDMMQQLATFAANTPFEMNQTETAAKQMLALGWNAKDVIPDLTAVGDAASGMGLGAEGINRIILALGQMKAHGTADAGDLLQLTQAGIPVWDMLSKAIGKTTAETQKMVTQGAIPANQAINIIMAGMEQRFPHMMDAQSKSFAGLMSTLSDNFGQTMGAVLKPAFDWITNNALPKLVSLTNEFSNAAKSGNWDKLFRDILPASVVNTFETFGGITKDVFGFLSDHLPLVASVLGTILTIWMGYQIVGAIIKGIELAQLALNAVLEMNPFVAIAAVVIFLAMMILTHWQQISSFLSNTWKGIKDLASSVWNGIMDFFKKWGVDLLAVFLPVIGLPILIAQHWQQIVQFAQQIWGAVVDFVTGLWNGFVAWIKNAAQAVADAVVGAFEWMYNHNYYVKELVDFIVQLWTQFTQWITNAWNAIVATAQKIWTTLQKWFTGYWNTEVAAFKKIWDTISAALSAVWNAIVGVAKAVWQPIADFFKTLWDGISSVASNVWNAISGTLERLWNGAIDKAKSIWNGLGDFFKGLWNEAVQWGSNLIQMFINGIMSKVNAVKDAVKNVIGAVGSFLGFHSPAKEGEGAEADQWMPNLMNMLVDGIKSGTPALQSALGDAIPGFGSGLTANLNNSLAQVGKTGSGSRPILVYLDGREIARGTAPHLVDEIRLETGLRV